MCVLKNTFLPELKKPRARILATGEKRMSIPTYFSSLDADTTGS